MAIQKSVTTNSGFDANDAYHRVEGIRFESKQSMSFKLCSYKSVDQQVPFNTQGYNCVFDLDGSNPYAQAYAYVKTLDNYADATDC